jgi:hypothetical protein
MRGTGARASQDTFPPRGSGGGFKQRGRANAMTLHRQAAEQANAARRSAIDEAITDFAGAIGEVVVAAASCTASMIMP